MFSSIVGSAAGLFGVAACLLVVVVLVWVALTYNRLVRQRNQVQASFAHVDVQLKRRYDLIPNLVETVKAYASHEAGTLEAVVRARGAAMAAGSAAPADRAAAENALSASLGRLLVLAEAYPTLRASENFAVLQSELAATEDKISYARQFFETADGERGPVQVRF